MTALARIPLHDIEQAVTQALVAPSAHATKDRAYYKKKAKAEATYKAYRSDLRDFVSWAGIRFPLPATAGLVIQYLVDRAETLAPSTLAHRVAALSFVHRTLGFPDPTIDGDVKDVLAGIKRDRREGGWRTNQAPALTLAQLRSLIDALPLIPALPGDQGHVPYLRDLRDRAFILTGIVGGFRQSELTQLTVAQGKVVDGGLVFTLGITKTDPAGDRNKYKALPAVHGPYCPVSALHAWTDEANLTEGAIFRGINRHGQLLDTGLSHTTANRILQTRAHRAGLDQAYSIHSLRASFVTILRGLEVPDPLIARQTHHTNLVTLSVYDRPEQAMQDSPAQRLVEAMAATAGGR